MILTTFDWIYGVTQLAVVFLAIIAGILALSMMAHAGKRSHLAAWRYLLIGLLFFAVLEVFGSLKAFGVLSIPWITHVLASFVIVFVIIALSIQIQVNKGWIK